MRGHKAEAAPEELAIERQILPGVVFLRTANPTLSTASMLWTRALIRGRLQHALAPAELISNPRDHETNREGSETDSVQARTRVWTGLGESRGFVSKG
jgi:hypothetical protein